MSVCKKAALCAVISASVLAGQAFAKDNKIFLEGAVGQGKAEDFCTDMSGLPCDDSDTSFRIGGGVMLSDAISLDISYTDFGDAAASGTNGFDSFNLDGTATALAIQAAIHAPVGSASLFAKGGFAYTKVNLDGYVQSGGILSRYRIAESDSAMKPVFSFGLELPLGKISLTGQYDRILSAGDDETTGETDLSAFSVGVKVPL